MSDHAKLLRRLNIKLQGRTTAIGGSDHILLIASRTLADAAEHIDQLVRERDGLLDGRTQAEGQRNDAEAEARKSAAECIRLQAENERLRGELGAVNDKIAELKRRDQGEEIGAYWFDVAREFEDAILASKEQDNGM